MHFYTTTENGVEPRHFVENKSKGGLRASRVTDARKAAKEKGEIWLPSVTGILNILDKPALTTWKIDRHLETVFEFATKDHDKFNNDLSGVGSWSKMIKAKTQEKMDSAPKAGTDIHNVLEENLFYGDYLDTKNLTDIEVKIIENVEDVLVDLHVDIAQHLELEKYFANTELGYAGQADLVTHDWVIDYKSKQEASKFKPGKMAYMDHSRQLAAYGRALCKEGFRAANIFICLETGEIDFHEHTQEQLQHGWDDFKDCLRIYHRNTFNPFK